MNELGEVHTEGNGSFTGGGALQHLWDSTSLGALKQCPRYYELSIVRGYAPRALAVDLRFGLLMHSARERFYRARAQGTGHDEALACIGRVPSHANLRHRSAATMGLRSSAEESAHARSDVRVVRRSMER